MIGREEGEATVHPAGWYPSPTETNLLRYWNGAAWTSYTQQRAGNPGGPVYPPGSYPQPVQAVAAKSPAVSVLVSLFIPGVGSIINGNVGTGIAILALWLISFPLMFFVVGFVTVSVAFVWGLIDAYQSAQRWNARHGIIS